MLSDSQRAALALRLRRGRETAGAGIPRRPDGLTELPLSFGQEQLWFIDRFAPGQPTYNIPHAVRVTGPLDVAALARARHALVARHEALRTRLAASQRGRPVQVVDPPSVAPLELIDLSGLADGERQARLRELMDTEAVRPFDLAADRLLRMWLIQLSPAEQVLLIVVHHTVFDGWSAGILVRELAALYGQETTGEPAGLAELPVQFADYAIWERDRLRGATLAELEDYWRQAMAGFETLALPADRPRPLLDRFDGRLILRQTSRPLLDGLRELSQREGTTLFVTLMAALQVLLHRYTGQTDVVVGTASANRSRAELAPLVGFLVNTLPIRGDLSGDPAFTELLAQLRQTTLGAYAHQELPFAKLVETLGVERDLSRAPVFQVALTYAERQAEPVLAAGVEFMLTDLIVGIDAAKFDLAFLAEARPGGLWFECSYKTALFEAATVERLLGHLETLLAGVVAHPGARLSELPVLTEAERWRELVEWNDTAVPFPAVCIHEGFEAQVRAEPGAVAAEFGAQRWTYGELNEAANWVARRLRDLGVGPESLVGVAMEVGLRRLAVLLGVWKAGGGYVPLDPELPPERLEFVLDDTAMAVVIADSGSAGRVPARPGVAVLDVDAAWDDLAGLDGSDLAGTGVGSSDVAYVIYTSGSTGRPKGVVVEHRQALTFLQGMVGAWGIGPGGAVLSFAAFTFDVSVMDMFMPLLAGARVVLAPPGVLHAPPRLAGLIRSAGVTFCCLPPAVLSLLTGERFPGLRTLLSAGEELSSELLRSWLRDGTAVYNGYGPTEASIGAVFMRLDESVPLPPPIGRPKPNYRAYVLDGFLNPVPVGVTGELHIGGPGVTRGYLRRPGLTSERFIADPFGGRGGRLYRTGDLVRRRVDGTIEFAGRADNQVKIRGLRVELGEIETALTTLTAIAQAVVTVITDSAGQPQLAGYLRPVPGATVALSQVREHLSSVLPAYMVPTYLTEVAEFPLTANGKIDKAALPAPQRAAAGSEQLAPATLLETALVDFYATVLASDEVGATDSFFDLGGNSLQAMQLITELRSNLAVDLDITAVFLAPTPRQLAAVLRDEHGFDDADLPDDGVAGALGPAAELARAKPGR
jgi:amino acid adenylation domain-containing protein